MRGLAAWVCAAWFGLACLTAMPAFAELPVDESATLNDATHALCGKKVALLGEDAGHGDGHTVAFKAQLARRLIERCGFKAILFEASYYEFGHLAEDARTGKPVTAEGVSIALSGLWNGYPDMQPFMAFLADRANQNGLVVAGIDDRWAVRGQTYSNETLPAALAGRLPEGEAEKCRDAFHRRIFSGAPTAESLTCLADIRAVTPTIDTATLRIIDSLTRSLARADLPNAEVMAGREQSMFANFQSVAADLPPDARIIVWGATVHLAKFKTDSGGKELPCFGTYVHHVYGDRAFSLGFGALSGTSGEVGGGGNATPLRPAPANSLEAQALVDRSAVFVPPRRLKKMGTVPAALFTHDYETRDWSRFLDGVIVFRQAYPGGQ